jgi:hypothetical protein
MQNSCACITCETTGLEMNVKMLENKDEIFCRAKDSFFAKKRLTFRKKKTLLMQVRAMPHRIAKRRKERGDSKVDKKD